MIDYVEFVGYFMGITSVLMSYYYINNLKNKKYKPKNRKPKKNISFPNFKRVSIDRTRYSKKKIPNNIDVIVVGSGIGGLSVAAFLSKLNYKVLVLEQHYIAGGCCHSFDLDGIEHETGIHYIGNISKRKEVLDLITDTPLKWCKMGHEDNQYVYDEIIIEEKKYKFRAGTMNFIKDMMKHFPTEKLAILKYIKLIKTAAKKDLFFKLKVVQNKYIAYLLSFFLGRDYFKFCSKSAYDIIKELTSNELLISVLCGQFGDYGPTPKKASFFIHASIVNHYLEGGYYPAGGPSQIVKKIITTIEKAGGIVLVGKKVNKILIEKNKAIGVEMENGDLIYSTKVVSSVGIYNTFQKLITNPIISNKYNNIFENIKHSTGHIYLFVKLKGNPRDLQLRSSNIWNWPNRDYDKMLSDFEKDPLNAPLPYFMGFSCMKDYQWESKYKNISNAIILTIGNLSQFKKWENEKCMNRSEDYQQLKEKYAQRLLEEALFKNYPHLRDKVLSYEVATPLTSQFYLNAFNGESYGLNTNSYRYLKAFNLKPKTSVENLYLTGQDICSIGFTGALMSGLITTNSILGYGTVWDIVINRDFLKDIKNI